MKNLILSAFSDEYTTSFEEQLVGMQKLGISHVELRFLDGKNVSLLTDEEVTHARKLLDAYGIHVSAIGSPLGKIRLDEDLGAHMETARRVFAIANWMGTRLVRMFSFYAPKGREIHDMRDEVLAALFRMLSIAREYDVVLCHENEAKIYGNTPLHCRDLLDTLGGEMKCVFDMGNFVLEGVDPYPDAYRLLKKDVAYFHIKDALSTGAIVPPGCGEASIREILAEHSATSDTPVLISLEPHLSLKKSHDSLVGRAFANPYQYDSATDAFVDATKKLRELIQV